MGDQQTHEHTNSRTSGPDCEPSRAETFESRRIRVPPLEIPPAAGRENNGIFILFYPFGAFPSPARSFACLFVYSATESAARWLPSAVLVRVAMAAGRTHPI